MTYGIESFGRTVNILDFCVSLSHFSQKKNIAVVTANSRSVLLRTFVVNSAYMFYTRAAINTKTGSLLHNVATPKTILV